MNQQITIKSMPLAVATWAEGDWCHAECFARWSALSDFMKGTLGGHVHFAEDGTWRVPESGCPPMRDVGEWTRNDGVKR